MIDCLLEEKSRISEGSCKIIDWLSSNKNDIHSPTHDNVIIELFRQVSSKAEYDYLNPDGVLNKLAIKAFDRQNPGFISKQVKAFIDSFELPKINGTNETNENQ